MRFFVLFTYSFEGFQIRRFISFCAIVGTPSELFVEQLSEQPGPLPALEVDSVLLLLKHYDPLVCLNSVGRLILISGDLLRRQLISEASYSFCASKIFCPKE